MQYTVAPNAAAAGSALAAAVAETVRDAARLRPTAWIALPGGRSPRVLFSALFDLDLPWPRVTIVPTDERCVPREHKASNEGMIAASLAGRPAAAARVLSLLTTASLPEDGMPVLLDRLSEIPLLFDAVVLGMGEDGHVASIFPEAPLGAGAAEPPCLTAEAPIEPQRRISLSLGRLLATRALYVFCGGANKLRVLDAVNADPELPLPIAAVLRGHPEPRVFAYTDDQISPKDNREAP